MVTKLPAGKKVVSCKWNFTVKYNYDGSVNWFKARLVARGFTQPMVLIIKRRFLLSLSPIQLDFYSL